MDMEKRIFNLMVKRVALFNGIFLIMFYLVTSFDIVMNLFYVLLFLDVLIILIEIIKGTHYPIYCYIYHPFKILFEYENKNALFKHNQYLYYILLIPLLIVTISKPHISSHLSTGVLKLPFLLILIMMNAELMMKLHKYKANNVKR